jgi:ferric-dicitrate binding protein FerR (iron transport regulator)
VAGTFLVFQLRGPGTESMAVVATDKIVTDTLPDGSKAVVNKGSSLSFEYNPKKKTRTAKLQGEAFFEVKHSEEETFIVETSGVFIQDIGTAFNIKNSGDGKLVEVQVREGEVRFFDDAGEGITLVAGETGQYDLGQKLFSKLQPEDENMSAWADRDFRFRNSPLKRVLKKLNEVYETPIELSSENLGECRITVNFRQDDIQTIADIIAETLGLSVSVEEGRILLSGESCQ